MAARRKLDQHRVCLCGGGVKVHESDLTGFSTFCFPTCRPLQGLPSRSRRDLLGLRTYDRCDAQLEVLNGFDSGLFVHFDNLV
jgi:hypothetical protein